MIKLLKYFTQASLIYLFFICGRLLGLKISRKIFSSLFCKLAYIFKSNKIIDTNLNIFSSNLTRLEKKRIVSSMWKNYGKTFIEYVFLDFFRKEKSHVKISGEENLNFLIKNKRPVIFVSGHFANFEIMSMEITKRKINLATIYRPLNNYFLNPFMEYLRKKYVCQNQIKKGINGVRESIIHLKQDTSIALMIDQRLSEGEKINFFGKPAYTTTLPAQLAIKFNLSIIPVFIQRTENDNFEIEFQEEISTSEYRDKIKLSEKLNKILENMIRRNPGQWIWTHNRWK